jgi:hypothetical protein
MPLDEHFFSGHDSAFTFGKENVVTDEKMINPRALERANRIVNGVDDGITVQVEARITNLFIINFNQNIQNSSVMVFELQPP